MDQEAETKPKQGRKDVHANLERCPTRHVSAEKLNFSAESSRRLGREMHFSAEIQRPPDYKMYLESPFRLHQSLLQVLNTINRTPYQVH